MLRIAALVQVVAPDERPASRGSGRHYPAFHSNQRTIELTKSNALVRWRDSG
jgi:hypothetical protein